MGGRAVWGTGRHVVSVRATPPRGTRTWSPSSHSAEDFGPQNIYGDRHDCYWSVSAALDKSVDPSKVNSQTTRLDARTRKPIHKNESGSAFVAAMVTSRQQDPGQATTPELTGKHVDSSNAVVDSSDADAFKYDWLCVCLRALVCSVFFTHSRLRSLSPTVVPKPSWSSVD